MKRIFSCFLALLLVLCLAACSQEPAEDHLTQDEIDAILNDFHLGDKVELDDYSDEEQSQITDELEEGGFVITDEGILAPKDPVDEETLDNIVNDAITNGEVDLNNYNEAQKEQIKDKLEQEGLKPEADEPEQEGGKIPVVDAQTLTDAEIAEILKPYGIEEGTILQDDFKVEVDLSEYTAKQQEQIKAAAALMGLEFTEEGGKSYFAMMKIHIDQVEDNEHE